MARQSGALPGGGGIEDVNGDPGPNVELDASDIPSTGPSTVQADLDALKIALGGLIVIDDYAALERIFPNVAGVHTVNKQSIWLSQTGAPYLLPLGRTVAVVSPGTMQTVGAGKVTLIGDAPTALVSGDLVLNGFNILNAGAGDDIYAASPGGGFVEVEAFLLGTSAGTVENITASGAFRVGILPPAPGSTGIKIDGTIAALLWEGSLAQAPGGVPYIGWSVEPTATVLVDLKFESGIFIGDPTDSMLYIDPIATLPTGPLPTNIVGVEVDLNSIKNGAALFEPSGLGADAIEVLSFGNTGGPTSQFIGDARADTTVTPTPAPIVQTYVASNTWEVVPTTNGAIAPDDVELTLNVGISQRHSVVISGPVLVLQYDGPEAARTSGVSWKATADRAGGPATVDAQLQYDDGGGWTDLPDTIDSKQLLAGTAQEMEGRTVLPDTAVGIQLRLVSRTSDNGTLTNWRTIQISKGI